MNQLPLAIGIMVCENVIIEEETRNLTPVNCFTRRDFEEFPSELITINVVAFLTNGLGEMSLEVAIEALDNWEEIHRMTVRAKFGDPLLEYRCIFRLRRFSVPRAGHYQVSLIADGDTIAHRKIVFAEK